jgi:putative endonuclease
MSHSTKATDSRQLTGQYGEQLAAEYLRSAGMILLDRNWRPRGRGLRGELDLVARDGDELVIVEVKTRRSIAFGAPSEAVTARKLRALRSLALAWLDDRCIHAPQLRFDVVAVTLPPAGHPVIEHLRAV